VGLGGMQLDTPGYSKKLWIRNTYLTV
jgi:hypothetical protein